MRDIVRKFSGLLCLTLKKVDKINVRHFSHFNSCKKVCSENCIDVAILSRFHTSKDYSHGKKHLKIKIPPLNLNYFKRHKPMTDPFQATSYHVIYGGNFYVPIDNGQRYEASSSGHHMTTISLAIPPDFRVWENVAKSANCDGDGTGITFKVLSYNMLAQNLLESHAYLYTGCTPHNLEWEIRASHLYDEIISYAPDILCLQEVHEAHINSFYSKFEQIGYFGIFKKKTGHMHDGCAIYFKQSVFELKDQISVEFYQPELPILNRDNIGIMVKLVPRGLPCSPIVVATTHLLYNPNRTDVRLAQMQLLLAEIDRFAYYDNGQKTGHLPIILTGDFNSTPDSVVIKLLDRGHISAGPFRGSSDWKRICVTDNCQHLVSYLNRQKGYPTDFSNIKIYNSEYCNVSKLASRQPSPSSDMFSEMFNGDVITHALRLISVYDKCKSDDIHEASTFQNDWVTVDYIYFSACSSLRLVERLRLPTAAECSVLGCLPNDVYGSDHLALAATFEFTKSNV